MNTRMHGGGRRRSLWKGPALTTALIMVIPALGNRFVDGWNWNIGGFIAIGSFIFCLGLAYELITRKVATIAYRAAVGIALVASFVLVWGNFVQASDDVNPVPAAMMYLVVPIVAIIGGALARLRPGGMALALFATALAQALILAIVFSRNPPVTSWTGAVWRGFGGNAFFLMSFVGSALLFRKAAREQSAPGAA